MIKSAKPNRPLRCLLFGICLILCHRSIFAAPGTLSQEAASASFAIADAPDWVKPVETSTVIQEQTPDDGGISYLLIDRQQRLAPNAFFRHEVRRITSESGVQNGASISVSFDPSFQKLVFHKVEVVRDGAAVNRLERSRVNLLRREKDLERSLYDGSYTAQCELEDVRVGDLIEFAYTIEGANPVKNGKFSGFFPTQWTYPVGQTFLRFAYPAARSLKFLSRNRRIDGRTSGDRGVAEWVAEQSQVPARKLDDDSPSDYDPRGTLQVTEYNSWREVVNWAVPLFEVKAPPSPDFTAKVSELKRIDDPEKRILAALRFVQDEIRYLGDESGIGSHQPSAPGEVLRRRFGDCKDKALLLATLLQRSGIEATPALVSSTDRAAVADWLPAPDVFDHVIVRVRSDDAEYWLDGTRTQQRGPLLQVYVTPFGKALLLLPGSDDFTSVTPPPESFPRKKVVENYRVPAPEEAGDLEVITEYRGVAADRFRSSFQENGRQNTQKNYLQYYARRFPEIEVRQPLVFKEIEGENACTLLEFYRVPNIWHLDEAKGKYTLELFPSEVDQAAGSVSSSQRDDPLALDYPVDVSHEIVALMFEDWPLAAKKNGTANEFFRFREEAASEARRLRFFVSFATLADRVPVVALGKYNSALREVKDALGYTLSYSTPAQLEARRKQGNLNWPIAALWMTLMLIGTLGAVLYGRASKLAVPLLNEVPVSLAKDGLGGWLLLIAFHQIIRLWGTIGLGATFYSSVFNMESWQLLTRRESASYHPYWAPVLLFELSYGSLMLIFSGLLLFLFFKKRAVWPRSYALFLLLSVAGVSLDTYLSMKIPAADVSWSNSLSTLIQTTVATAVWVPYCFLSKRVRATFRY